MEEIFFRFYSFYSQKAYWWWGRLHVCMDDYHMNAFRMIMSSDGKDCTSRWFHTDYIIRKLWKTFQAFYRLALSERQVFVSVHFCDTFQIVVHGERDSRKRSQFVFFILQKKFCNVLLLLWVYTNEITLYSFEWCLLSVWPKMTEYF